jgi:hypothetical protein
MTPRPPEPDGCPCHERTKVGSKGWPDRRGPAPLLARRHGLPPYSRPRWVDHSYTLPLGLDRLYIAEPYELGPEAIEDLAFLLAAGFEVTIRTDNALHLRGHTMRIELLERRAADEARL